MRKKEAATSLVRVALYIRVSGEEQKMHGLSLEAQQERLEKFARERGWLISGIYIDAAKTARKHLHKRTEFQRMIEAVKLLARTEAILLDPVYSGKAMSGMIDLIRKDYFPKGADILFLHTGGSPALYAYLPTFR